MKYFSFNKHYSVPSKLIILIFPFLCKWILSKQHFLDIDVLSEIF